MKKTIILILIVLALNCCGRKEDVKICGIIYIPEGSTGLATVTARYLPINSILNIESSDKSKATVLPEILTGSGTVTIKGIKSSDKEGDVLIMVKHNGKKVAEQAFTVFSAKITKVLPKWIIMAGDDKLQEDVEIFYKVKPPDCKPDRESIEILMDDKILYTLKPEIDINEGPGMYRAVLPEGSEMKPGEVTSIVNIHLPDITPEDIVNKIPKSSLYDKLSKVFNWAKILEIVMVIVGVFIFAAIFWLTHNWIIKDKISKKGLNKKRIKRK